MKLFPPIDPSMPVSSTRSFTDQVFRWLLSTNWQFRFNEAGNGIFHTVEIQKAGNVVMFLKLIDLDNWKNTKGAKEEFLAYAAVQARVRSMGILSVTLWEDVWCTKKEIVKSRLNALLGVSLRIPGRLTDVRRIDRATCGRFLDDNHLQGGITAKFRYGLFLPARYFRVVDAEYQFDRSAPELLVAVAAFSHPRIFEKDDRPFRSCELVRFASIVNTTVVGGLDKFLHFFTNEVLPDDIMTYADLEWSDGASYRRLGFEAISDKPPINFCLDETTRLRYTENQVVRLELETNGPVHWLNVSNAGSRKYVKVSEPEI